MADSAPKRTLRRRRQPNVAGGRKARYELLVSPDEDDRLVALAEAQSVTVQRLVVEAALSADGASTPSARRADLAALFALQRTLSGAANNINQLARWGNADERRPPGTDEAVAEIRRVVTRLDQVLEDVARLCPTSPGEGSRWG